MRTVDDGSAYITSPPLAPVLPPTVTTSTGISLPTRDALPIARAVLLAGAKVVKQIPGGAKATEYMLERACYHLTRVRIGTSGPAPSRPVGRGTTIESEAQDPEPPPSFYPASRI